MNRRISLILVLTLFSVFFFYVEPEAKAIDPVTLAILTPLAIKGAQIAAPYVFRGLKNMGVMMIKAGTQLIGMLRLPLGILKCIFMAPFSSGIFLSGLADIGIGLVSPFYFGWYVLLLPVSAFGVGI